MSRSAERSKRIFTGGVVAANGICNAAFCESAALRACPLPLGGAVAQRLRGSKSAEPEKTVKRSSRRTGVNLQFFRWEPTSLGLSRASSPWPVAGWVESRGREGGVGTPLPTSGPAERLCTLKASSNFPRRAWRAFQIVLPVQPAPHLQIKIASFLRFTAIFSNFAGM